MFTNENVWYCIAHNAKRILSQIKFSQTKIKAQKFNR